MSLLEDLQAVEPGYNGMSTWHVLDEGVDAEVVDEEYLDSGRWSEHHRAVFKRGNEYVAMEYEVPATEMQEGGDFDYEFYVVEPYEVTVTKYRKVK